MKRENMLVAGADGISEQANNLSSVARARFVDLISEGEIFGLVNGTSSVYVDGVPLVGPEGGSTYKPFRYVETKGTQDQAPIPGFSGTQQENAVNVQLRFSTGKLIRPVTDADADSVRVTVSVSGLMETTGDGQLIGSSVKYKISLRLTGGPWVEAFTGSITGKTSAKYQKSHEVMLKSLGTGPYDVAVERLTADPTSSLIQNDLYWDSYAIINFEQFAYPNSALIATEIDGRYFSNVPQRQYHVKGLLVKVPSNYNPVTRIYSGVWDGTFKAVKEYTNNPAWCFYDLLTNKRYGLGKRISEYQINKWDLYQIAQYCDGLVPTGITANVGLFSSGDTSLGVSGGATVSIPLRITDYEPRFTLNCVINTKDDAYKVLANLSSVFRGMSYWAAGSVACTQDRPTEPSMIWTNANVIDGKFRYEGSPRDQRHTTVTVAWNDPEEGFKQKFEYVEDKAGITRYGIRAADVVAFGCTSRSQARRFGLWMLYTERIEKDAIRFRVGMDSAMVLPGEVGEIMDNDRAGIRWGGRLISATDTVLTLDAPVSLAAGNYTISVMCPDGQLWTRALNILGGGLYTAVTVSLPLPSIPQANALWTIASPALSPILGRVISVKQEGDDQFEISCLEHNPSKYLAIEEGEALQLANYSFLSITDVPPVQNLTAIESTFRLNVNTPIQVRVELGWSPATNNLIRGYVIKYRGSKGAYGVLPEQPDCHVTIDGLSPDLYAFSVHAVNQFGREGADVVVNLNVLGVAAPAPDITPPTPLTGLTVVPGFSRLSLRWNPATYTQGGGNAKTRIYRATYLGTGPLPTFISAVLITEVTEPQTFYDDEAPPGSERRYWARHVSRAGVEQVSPTGGLNGVQGLLAPIDVPGTPGPRGNVNLAVPTTATEWDDDIADAALLADGYGAAQVGDVVTLFNSTASYSESRVFSSSGWISLDAYIHGNLLVDGTIVVSKIDTRGLTMKRPDGTTILSFDVALDGQYISNLNADTITAGQIRGLSHVTVGTYLTGASAAADTVLHVKDTIDLPSSGKVWIVDTINDRNLVTYTGKTAHTLTGCGNVFPHTSGSTVVPADRKAMIVDANVNEMRFYGDRGDGVFEETVSIGLKSPGGPDILDQMIVDVGMQELANRRLALRARTGKNNAIWGGNYDNGLAGIYGENLGKGPAILGRAWGGGPAIVGDSSGGPGGKFLAGNSSGGRGGFDAMGNLHLPPVEGRPNNVQAGQLAMIFTSGGGVDHRSDTPRLMYSDGTDWRRVSDDSVYSG
jgi:predicted phage tail protein